MADSRELTPGMSMELPGVPLRLTLDGVTGGARLEAAARDGSEAAQRRVGATELIVLPIKGRYRVEAVPTDGVAFPAGSRLGLGISTDSTTVESRQGFMKPRDVGALQGVELAELVFRDGHWIATAAAAAVREHLDDEVPEPLDEHAHPWVGPGRFALRRAISEGAPVRPGEARPWSLVVDSSASMRCTFTREQLAGVVEVVAGILAEWTGRAPLASYATGLVEPLLVAGEGEDPTVVTDATWAAVQPAGWSLVTPAVRASMREVDEPAAVVVVTDGVPGDVADLVALAGEDPDLDVFLVTTGVSRFGLASDGRARRGWEEELGALEPAADLPNVTIAALAPGAGLDEGRAAELAAVLLRSWT